MASDTVPALVLDQETVAHGEPVHFGVYPGVWAKGTPIAVRDLGFESEEEALDRARELGLPLTETTVAADAGVTLLPRPNAAPSLDEVRNQDWDPEPGEPGAQLAPGEAFPPDPRVALDQRAEQLAAPLDVNVDEALAVVAGAPLEELDALELAETEGRNRSSVLAAIADRRAAAAPPEQPGEGV